MTRFPVRTYSLSGDPAGGEYRISVKRESHGLVSRYLHEHLQPGEPIEVAAPRGDFVLDESSDPVLLISAGIGLTPVLAMLHRLASEASTREVWWIHTTHDADSHAFSAEVADLVDGLPAAHCAGLLHDSEHAARDQTRASGPGGSPPTWSRTWAFRRRRTPTCAARSRSWTTSPPLSPVSASTLPASTPSGSRRGRRSTPASSGRTRHRHTSRPDRPASARQVTFARSGLTTEWSDTYASVLELAEACDVPTRWSCRTGVCHTCVTAVLSGTASYVTPPLEAPGEGEVLICSAQPTEDLVIDL